MRKKRGELAARFAAGAGNKGNKFAVQPSFSNQQSRRHRNTHPAILQDIDCQAGAAGSEFTIDAQFVVDASESGVNRRRLRVALDGISPRVKGAVFLDRQNDPARRVSSSLTEDAGTRKEYERHQTSAEQR